MNTLKLLEDKIEAGFASSEDRETRIKLLQEVDKLDNFEALDSIQKARYDYMVTYSPLPNPSGLSEAERDLLEVDVSMDEVKAAAWDCGSDKAPGPDGFSFAFVKKFWNILKHDILEFVTMFFESRKMPPGANSSFISLIPKVSNPKVVDKIVSHEQSAFISGRQILGYKFESVFSVQFDSSSIYSNYEDP
ncbi:hypothetical protein Tco_1577036 [Tanacetum coccineum]